MSDLTPPTALDTDRLSLRQVTSADTRELGELVRINLEFLVPWLPWAAHEPITAEERNELIERWAKAWSEGTQFEYILRLSETGAAIGMLGAYRRVGPQGIEIGYWLDDEHVGRGLVTEAARELTRTLIALDDIHRVEIHAEPGNVRSLGVPARLGYTREGVLRDRAQKPDGSWRDLESWSFVDGDVLL